MNQSSNLLFSNSRERPPFEMRREPSYLYINEDKRLIITDPLFSQPIPSNPPQISWIRYSIHDLLLEVSLNDYLQIKA